MINNCYNAAIMWNGSPAYLLKREGGKGILNNKIASVESGTSINNGIMYNLKK